MVGSTPFSCFRDVLCLPGDRLFRAVILCSVAGEMFANQAPSYSVRVVYFREPETQHL